MTGRGPFECYAYRFAHLDVTRANTEEANRARHEVTGVLNAGYDALENVTDPGNL